MNNLFDDWEEKKINQIANVNTKQLDTNSNPDKEYSYLEISAVDSGRIIHPRDKIPINELPSRARRVLSYGDVIMSTVRPNLLAYALCNFIPEDVLCSTGFALITPKDIQDSKFIYQSLYSDYVQRQLNGLITGSNYPAINSREVEKLKILYPKNKKVRVYLSDILSTWDEAIAKTEKLIAALEQRKKGLMQRLLTGEVRFPGYAENWRTVELQDVAHVVMGQSPSSSAYNESAKGLPLIQGNSDINNGVSSPRMYTTEVTKLCKIGDILLSVRAPVGETSISKHKACIGRGIAALRGEDIDHRFLYHLMKFDEGKWQKYAQGSTFSAINSKDIREFLLQIPTTGNEQKKISSVLDLCDTELSNFKEMLGERRKEKKGLMQRLLTGQVRVNVD